MRVFLYFVLMKVVCWKMLTQWKGHASRQTELVGCGETMKNCIVSWKIVYNERGYMTETFLFFIYETDSYIAPTTFAQTSRFLNAFVYEKCKFIPNVRRDSLTISRLMWLFMSPAKEFIFVQMQLKLVHTISLDHITWLVFCELRFLRIERNVTVTLNTFGDYVQQMAIFLFVSIVRVKALKLKTP